MVDQNVPVTTVWASRGKVTRAEPVSALYEQGRMHHVGTFPQLEDQMTNFTSDFDRQTAGYSPDRLDALVWATTELLVEQMKGANVFELMRRRAAGETLEQIAKRPEVKPADGSGEVPSPDQGDGDASRGNPLLEVYRRAVEQYKKAAK